MQRFSGSSPSALIRLIASAMALGILSPLSLQGQPSSDCTVYQHASVTEDVRSTLSEEWNEDETSWKSDKRTVISYEGGNPSKVTIQIHEQSGTWRSTSRARATYDSSDRITRCTRRGRKNGDFVNDYRENFSYNSNGRLHVATSQDWKTDEDAQGTWVNFFRKTRSYDDNGNQIQLVEEKWDRDSDRWMNSRQISHTYDSNDRIVETLEEEPNGSGGWRNSAHIENTYGSEGIIKSVTKEWDRSTSTWQKSDRSLFSYPTSDSMRSVIQTWDKDRGSWVNNSRTTTNQATLESLYEVWNESQDRWVNSYRTKISYTTYNETRKFQRWVAQIWDTSSGEWVNSYRKTYSYTDIIPVELVSFRAVKSEGSVMLRWQTASETSNAGFQVQRKTGPSSVKEAWRTIGQVEGQGTTAEVTSYQFTDKNLPYKADRLTYRLKQVDTDGSTSISKKVTVERDVKEVQLLGTYPNPAQQRATLRYAVPERREVAIHLYDALGRQMRTVVKGQKAGRHEKQLDISGLASGVYFLRLKTEIATKTQRLTVVR